MASGSDKQSVARLRNVTGALPSRKAYWKGASNTLHSGALGIAAVSIAPTAAAASVGGVSGTVNYFETLYDELHDSEGNPNPVGTQITVASKRVLVTLNAIADARPTRRRIYRTVDGGIVPLRIGSVAVSVGTYYDSATDASISANPALETDNDAPLADLRGLHGHAARAFAVKGSNLYGSKASNLDQWPALNVLAVKRDDGYDIKAVVSGGSDLVIFKERGIFVMRYDIDPFDVSDSTVQQLIRSRGALNEFCVVDANGALYAMDEDGIYAYTVGGRAIALDTDILSFMRLRDMRFKDWFSGCATRDRVYFFFAMVGDELASNAPACHWALALDLTDAGDGRPVWWLYHFDHPIRHASTFRDGKLWAQDAYGTNLCMDYMDSDGVPLNLTSEFTATVVATVSTKTRISVASADGVFTSSKWSSYDVTRLYCRWEDASGALSKAYRIAAVGTSGSNTYIDLSQIVSPAPVAGDTIYIGGIFAEYQTPVMDMGDAFTRKQAQTALVSIEPTPTPANARLSVSRDRIGTSYNASTEAARTSFETTSGQPHVTLKPQSGSKAAMPGVMRVPIGIEGFNVMQFIVSVRGGNKPLRFNELRLDPKTLTAIEGE